MVDIIVYKGGEVSHWLPRPVWYALKQKGLILPPSVRGEPWVIPPDKFSQVDNLTVLDIEYSPEIAAERKTAIAASKDKKNHIEQAIMEARRRGQAKAEEIAREIDSGARSWFPCGGAWIVGVKKNTAFGKVFNRLCETITRFGSCHDPRHASIFWSIDSAATQSMYLDQQASMEFCKYINEELGLNLSVRTFID